MLPTWLLPRVTAARQALARGDDEHAVGVLTRLADDLELVIEGRESSWIPVRLSDYPDPEKEP